MNILRHPATLTFLILLVVVLFGYKRLPDVARSVGQSMKIFKGEMKSLKDDDAPADAANPAAPAAPDATLQHTAQNTAVHNGTAPHGIAPNGAVNDATSTVPMTPPAVGVDKPAAGPATPSV